VVTNVVKHFVTIPLKSLKIDLEFISLGLQLNSLVKILTSLSNLQL